MSALAGCRALVGARLQVALVADSGVAPRQRGFVQVSAGIMEIENLIRSTALAVGLMEIENLFRSTALAVGLKPSASQGEARLRGL